MLLPISADAAKKAYRLSGNLMLVGTVTTETVAVEIPVVENPVEATDAHWTPLIQEGEAVALSVTDNSIRIEGNMQIRLNKAAGVGGNAYGVRRL